MDIPSPFSTKAILPFCLGQPASGAAGEASMPSISLFKSLSHGDMADSAAPASHLVPRRTYLQIRHPHCPRPKKCRLHLLLQVNLGSQISRSTDSQGIHSSSRLVRPTETCCRQRRHGRNHLTQQREQDLSSSRQEGSYVACRLPSSDTRSGDPSPLCQHWMLSLRERSQWSCLCITAPGPIACLSHGQCPAGPCCHLQVTAREHT